MSRTTRFFKIGFVLSIKTNYLFAGTEELLQRLSPTYRGPADAYGNPTRTVGVNADVNGVAQMTLAEAVAEDKELQLPMLSKRFAARHRQPSAGLGRLSHLEQGRGRPLPVGPRH